MSLRTSPFKLLCFAIIMAATPTCIGQANPGSVSGEQPFAPFERWKDLVIAGDAAGLKRLYSTNPVAHVMTASGAVDSDAAVHYWIGLKVRGMKVDIVQTGSPQPGARQVVFQAEIRSAAGTDEKTLYITEAQLWQQQGPEWRLVVTKRSDATRLQQPVTDKKNIYEAKADAHADIKEALEKATKERKRVLVVFGANWCYDCHVLDLAFQRPDVAPVVGSSYIVVHVDVGQGEKNQDLMKQYDVPMERGIPAVAVLGSDGMLLYSQKKGEFEKARGLGPEDLLEFLNKWKPAGQKT